MSSESILDSVLGVLIINENELGIPQSRNPLFVTLGVQVLIPSISPMQIYVPNGLFGHVDGLTPKHLELRRVRGVFPHHYFHLVEVVNDVFLVADEVVQIEEGLAEDDQNHHHYDVLDHFDRVMLSQLHFLHQGVFQIRGSLLLALVVEKVLEGLDILEVEVVFTS